MADTTTPPSKSEERSKAVNASYSQAQQWLTAQHQDEFNAKRKEILAAQGIEWNPPLTQEQKDEAALLEIAGRNPALARRLVGVVDKATPPTDPHS